MTKRETLPKPLTLAELAAARKRAEAGYYSAYNAGQGRTADLFRGIIAGIDIAAGNTSIEQFT